MNQAARESLNAILGLLDGREPPIESERTIKDACNLSEDEWQRYFSILKAKGLAKTMGSLGPAEGCSIILLDAGRLFYAEGGFKESKQENQTVIAGAIISGDVNQSSFKFPDSFNNAVVNTQQNIQNTKKPNPEKHTSSLKRVFMNPWVRIIVGGVIVFLIGRMIMIYMGWD